MSGNAVLESPLTSLQMQLKRSQKHERACQAASECCPMHLGDDVVVVSDMGSAGAAAVDARAVQILLEWAPHRTVSTPRALRRCTLVDIAPVLSVYATYGPLTLAMLPLAAVGHWSSNATQVSQCHCSCAWKQIAAQQSREQDCLRGADRCPRSAMWMRADKRGLKRPTIASICRRTGVQCRRVMASAAQDGPLAWIAC